MGQKNSLFDLKRFASENPSFSNSASDTCELENEGKEYVQVPLAQIFWYHHIPLLSKVKDEAQRAYDITETA